MVSKVRGNMDVTSKDKAWYALALKVAGESECVDMHGCVLVRKGTVIALATNRKTTHPVSKNYLKDTLHAEQRAISKGVRTEQAKLYSARVHDNPQSAPCIMCLALIVASGISRVIYHDGATLVKVRVR